MSPLEHYRAAERELELAKDSDNLMAGKVAQHVAAAQVHATLALVGVTAIRPGDPGSGDIGAPAWRAELLGHNAGKV